MNSTGNPILTLLAMSFSQPAEAAKIVTGTRYDRTTLWMALALVTVLSVLAVALGTVLMPEAIATGMPDGVAVTPFTYALIMGASLVMLVFALYFVGKSLGGTGHFPETLNVVIWLQVMSLALQMVQIIALLFSPLVASLIGLVGAGFLFFAMLHFISVLHGFGSLLKAFGTFALAIIGIAFGAAIILSLIGVTAQGIPNV